MFNDEEFSVYNGEKLTVKVYGASHSEKIGVVADGLNGGFKTDLHSLNKFLSRRKPTSSLSTSRTEEDEPVFLSGIDGNGVLTGERFEAVIYNRDVKSEDYSEKKIPRPSHADFVGWSKYGDGFDNRGGGKFSGRLTAPICVLGGIIKQILAERGIKINAFISAIGKINGKSYKTDDLTDESFESENGILLSDDKKEEMLKEVENAKAEGDSVGGKIDCVITGVPVGTGEYMFSAAEGKISRLAFAVPAVKGIEFGDGFDLVKMKGSAANDQFAVENGKIVTTTNRNGGINGGIANGMPITFSVAIKPTPSIKKEQNSVDMNSFQPTVISVNGRHDACIALRAVPVIEAVAAIAIYDML